MKQITIIAKDRPGLMAEITEALAAGGINIESAAAERVERMSVVILTVDRYDKALAVLRDRSFDAVTEDALVVRLKDEPGALARVARRFTDAGINLRSLRIILREDGYGLVAVCADEPDRARELVKDLMLPARGGS